MLSTWWTKAAFDGEVPQPLYGVGVSGIDRGTSPAATPVNDSGFFLLENLEAKTSFFWKVICKMIFWLIYCVFVVYCNIFFWSCVLCKTCICFLDMQLTQKAKKNPRRIQWNTWIVSSFALGLQHGSWCRLQCWTGRWPPVEAMNTGTSGELKFGIQRTGWSKPHILIAFQCMVLFPVLARMSDIHFLLPSALDLGTLYIFVYQWNVLSDMTLLRACFGPFSLHGLCFRVVCKKSMDRKYDTDGTSCWWLSLGSKVTDYSWPIHAVFWCLLESGVPSWSLSWFVRLDRADRRFFCRTTGKHVFRQVACRKARCHQHPVAHEWGVPSFTGDWQFVIIYLGNNGGKIWTYPIRQWAF